eukprot:SAG11_NODE_17145_length_527_cov_0.803738_2_plen_98_part_01
MEAMLAMGFREAQCRIALAQTGGDVEAAVSYIMANLDQPDAFWEAAPPQQPPPLSAAAAAGAPQHGLGASAVQAALSQITLPAAVATDTAPATPAAVP